MDYVCDLASSALYSAVEGVGGIWILYLMP